ncbi:MULTISPECIES: response regulator transcription factor [Leptolyngbya]|uniref:response regulator transcription factor n=1 Tax=Leptolyngbya TaxID=47251 RepID=UPI00168A033E|nr:response regulator transcription factor [Leptolyngbya sp. FACHB-1624]MBD1858015.1 response regulator transcription factor [Leptolyngbya sp. FACHB-1624]
MKIRLLLVDDQILVRQGLKAMLSLEPDFEIVGMAEHGEAAIAQFEQLHPDIVLMDVRMPVMNGSTATQILCEKYPGTKVLVLSTYDEDQDVAAAIRAGAKGYLLKDTPSEELATAIRSIHQGYAQLAPGILERIAYPSKSEVIPTEFAELTARELEVARLVAIGATNQEIADQLFISQSTVKTHVNSIFNRLNFKNRSQLAIFVNSALK